jgi:hypothetical protein
MYVYTYVCMLVCIYVYILVLLRLDSGSIQALLGIKAIQALLQARMQALLRLN